MNRRRGRLARFARGGLGLFLVEATVTAMLAVVAVGLAALFLSLA